MLFFEVCFKSLSFFEKQMKKIVTWDFYRFFEGENLIFKGIVLIRQTFFVKRTC